ncbi:MAG: hypothetical protein ACOX3Q_00685 [Clostridia bacterium]|jgi:DnaJ-domain-containing protein 1|nr:hypothetical protein [Clostridiaceae bacterium]
MNKNPEDYKVLGLSVDADIEQVKKAGTLLMKKYKDDPEKLDQINTAYNRIMGFTTDEKQEEKQKSGAFKFIDKIFKKSK